MAVPRCTVTATVATVRVATWNVNSLKQRLPRLLPWLDQRRPDVVCLQETKLADDKLRDLLGDELAARGYEMAVHGEAAWNGVAILSRAGLDDVVAGLPGGPGFPHQEARAVAATCAASAWSRSTFRTAARRTRTTTSTSSPGWRRCARCSRRARRRPS